MEEERLSSALFLKSLTS